MLGGPHLEDQHGRHLQSGHRPTGFSRSFPQPPLALWLGGGGRQHGYVAVSAGVRWSFGLFIIPLSEEFDWSTGSISFAYFLAFMSAVPLTLAGGWLTDRHGVRLVMPLGVVAFTLGMVLTSTVTELYQLYLFYGILVGGVHMVFSALLSAAVTRWFHRRIGVAVGLVFAATGLGPLVMGDGARVQLAVGVRRVEVDLLGCRHPRRPPDAVGRAVPAE